jgi:hypothetical protein
MKKILFIIIILFISLTAISQEKPKDKVLRDTTIKNVIYKIYQGNRGGKYYLKPSKTGTIYKVYLKK